MKFLDTMSQKPLGLKGKSRFSQEPGLKKVEIQISGAKRALERPQQGSSAQALLGAPRAEAAAPSNPRPDNDQHVSHDQRDSLQTAEKRPIMKVLSRFGRLWS